MVERLTKSTVNELMKINEPVCLSLYMPTYRSFPKRNENPIVFKNLLRQLKEQLQLHQSDSNYDNLLKQFERLQDDEDFWKYQQNGLAIFAGTDFFKVYTLAQPVPARTFICDHPYLTPLIRITQAADNYQVLCLTRDNIRLFEGNRDSLNEVSLHPDVPRTKEQALGSELTPADQTGYNQGFSAAEQRGQPYAHESGGGGKQAEIDIDRERYFRAVDKAIIKHYSRPSALPLILAALPENQAFFRAVSHNPFLQSKGITVDLSNFDAENLRQQCWQLMSAHYKEKITAIVKKYSLSHSKGLASSELAEIDEAAETGRIATLLVEADRLDAANAEQPLTAAEQQIADTTQHARDDNPDMLEELVHTVMQNGGEVMVVPAQRIPSQSGAAAIYHF